MYLPTPLQLATFSLSTTHRAAPIVALKLKEGMRPKEEVNVEAPKEEAVVVVNGETADAAAAAESAKLVLVDFCWWVSACCGV